MRPTDSPQSPKRVLCNDNCAEPRVSCCFYSQSTALVKYHCTHQCIELLIVFAETLALDHNIEAFYASNEQGGRAGDTQDEAGDFHIMPRSSSLVVRNYTQERQEMSPGVRHM